MGSYLSVPITDKVRMMISDPSCVVRWQLSAIRLSVLLVAAQQNKVLVAM